MGVVEILESGSDKVAFDAPIDRVYEMMARMSRLDTALPYLTQTVDLSCDQAEPLLELGMAYQLQKNFAAAEAEALMDRAVALEPRLGLAHFNLGMICFAGGRDAEGRKILELLHAEGSGYASMLSPMAWSAGRR